MGLLTGHRNLKGHVHKQGLVNGSEYDRCKQAYEMASHVLCDCETVATLRFMHLDQHFVKLGNLEEISISRILHLFKFQGC
jgi:hypothetical protein